MAQVKIQSNVHRAFGNVPYGNVTTLHYPLATNATGVALGSNSNDPLAVGDVVDLGPLPEGMRLDDATVFVLTGMTGSVTGSLGFKYEDGVDSTEVPQDAAYFGTGIALSSAARLRTTGTKLVALPKPARLILTIAGADNAKASEIGVLVTGVQIGPR